MSANHWHGIGNLGRDPEAFQSGDTTISKFSIACTEKRGGKETVEWVNCVAFGKLAQICTDYLTKGKQVYVAGRLSTRKWQDKDGGDRYSTEIILSEMRMLGGGEGKRETGGGGQEPTFNPDDDLPFALPMMYRESFAKG